MSENPDTARHLSTSDENDRDNLLIDEDALYGLGPENGSDWLQEGMRNALLPPPASGFPTPGH